MSAKGRYWCITGWMKDKPIFDEKKMGYLIYSREKCPSTGKEHWQAYVEYKNTERLSGVKKVFGLSAHCEVRKARFNNPAIEYCKKDATHIEGPFVFGEPSKGQGARTDLHNLCEIIKKGGSLKDCAEADGAGYVRNYRGLSELKKMYTQPRNWKMEVYIIYGPSDSGKTRSIIEKESNLYMKPEGQWWDGYNGEEAVLIDDIDWNKYAEWMSHTEWLKLLDRYQHKVPYKGGFHEFVSKRIYLTSMENPKIFLSLSGMKRRITSCLEVGQG